MNRKDLLNEAYLKSPNIAKSSRLRINFVDELLVVPVISKHFYETQNKCIAEIGSGPRSYLEDSSFKNQFDWAIGYDLSDQAISMAKQSLSNCLDYEQFDIVADPGFPNLFHYIIDGHCIHTLDSILDIKKALNNMKVMLKDDGFILGEVPISHKKLNKLDGYYWNDEGDSLFDGEGKFVRVLLDERQWESLFLELGYQIVFFYIQSQRVMIFDPSRDEPCDYDPPTLQFILKKSNAFS